MAGDVTNRPNILSSDEECDGLGRKGRERGQSAEEPRLRLLANLVIDYATSFSIFANGLSVSQDATVLAS